MNKTAFAILATCLVIGLAAFVSYRSESIRRFCTCYFCGNCRRQLLRFRIRHDRCCRKTSGAV